MTMRISSVGDPLPTEARQGRHNQKYGERGERLLAGCIPFRTAEAGNVLNGVEVLLVSRRNGDGWVLPKGGWESDEKMAEDAALRETTEEAGVRGDIVGPILGVFRYNSKKPQNFATNVCLAHIFAMKVLEVLDDWPEQSSRQRHWFSLTEAYNRCAEDWMRKALRSWVERNNWAPSVIMSEVDRGVNGGFREETLPQIDD